MLKIYERKSVRTIEALIARHSKPVHLILGPRQVGKTTAAGQLAARWDGPVHLAAAEESFPQERSWVYEQGQKARSLAEQAGKPCLMVLDEIQKIKPWAEVVKRLWDEEQRAGGGKLRMLLLGSSSLLLQKGMTESLAGRFMTHRLGQWSWPEMRELFGDSLEQWFETGGYPGMAEYRHDMALWRRSLRENLVDVVLHRDIFHLAQVSKPALMSQLFMLAAASPAQILSFNKMSSRLQEKGSAATLAHYMKLLEGAFLLKGLQPWRGTARGKYQGTPKIILLDNALAQSAPLAPSINDAQWRGRLVENAVGAHLLHHLVEGEFELCYWRQGDYEVDFVLKTRKNLWALEVKSGRPKKTQGIERFLRAYPESRVAVIGAGGIELETFFGGTPQMFFP